MSHNLRLLKTTENHPGQSIRIRPEGPLLIYCIITDKETGRTMTSAYGKKSRKNSAAGNAKQNALRQLKRRMLIKFDPNNHEVKYTERA